MAANKHKRYGIFQFLDKQHEDLEFIYVTPVKSNVCYLDAYDILDRAGDGFLVVIEAVDGKLHARCNCSLWDNNKLENIAIEEAMNHDSLQYARDPYAYKRKYGKYAEDCVICEVTEKGEPLYFTAPHLRNSNTPITD